MLKTYISLKATYFATDIIGGDGKFIARIAFEGGIRYPQPVNGIFVTNNKELQKAIEEDASYGVEFKLLRTEGKEEDPGSEYPEITTVGAARTLLAELFQKKTTNRAEVFAAAIELGISFPNLPVE